MIRPLDGILVVSFEQAIAAPFASRQLAEAGARVIKVERPGDGDFARAYDQRTRGICSHFVWVNRSKESLTLDIKHPAASEILDRLLAKADVVMQNLAPGAAARCGLGAKALRAKYSRIITCGISGYGEDDPYRDKKAYDLLVQSEAGLLAITGSVDEPAKAGIPVADIAAGTNAYSSILNAIILRGRTGVGSDIDVSMLEALTEWMGFPLYYTIDGQSAPPRAGASHATIYPYGPFSAGDNKVVVFAIQNEREWGWFCNEVITQPSLVEDARFKGSAARSLHRQALKQIIEGAFKPLSAKEVIDRLDAAKIANGRMNQLSELWAHPQLAARKHWAAVNSPVGNIPNLMPVGKTDGYAPRLDPIPAVGQHTRGILGELGFSDQTIMQMQSQGVI